MSIRSRTLSANRKTISMSHTGVGTNGSFQLNVFQNLLFQLSLDVHFSQLLVKGQDLRFRELIHSHLGVEPHFSTDLFGRFSANAENGFHQADTYQSVMFDGLSKNMDGHYGGVSSWLRDEKILTIQSLLGTEPRFFKTVFAVIKTILLKT